MKWNDRVLEYEIFFSNANLPIEWKLSNHEIIKNVPLFVNSHLEYCKTNKNKTFIPYLYRLYLLKLHIEKTR